MELVTLVLFLHGQVNMSSMKKDYLSTLNVCNVIEGRLREKKGAEIYLILTLYLGHPKVSHTKLTTLLWHQHSWALLTNLGQLQLNLDCT